MSFELLDKLGIKYRLEHVYKNNEDGKRVLTDLPSIHSILIPFTANEWLRMCMREGDSYIGGCCGHAGHIQDTINHIFRDSGWVEPDLFRELVGSCITHDGEDEWKLGDKLLESALEVAAEQSLGTIDIDNPWDKIVLVWNLSKDLLSVTCHERPHVPHTPLSGAWRQLIFFGHGLVWSFTDDKKNHAFDLLSKAKVWAAIKLIYETTEEEKGKEILCFGIRDESGELAEGYRGAALYETREEGEEFLEKWRKRAEEDDYAGRSFDRSKWSVGACRVTIEGGLEWLD